MDGCCGLLVLNFPNGAIFGIDKNVWKITSKFRGVNSVSPGLHYIFYSSVGHKGDIGLRQGFFQYFTPNKIYTIVWDEGNEDIKMDLSEADMERLESRWNDEKGLTTEYSKETAYTWHRLTRYITWATVRRLGLGKERIFIGPAFGIIASEYEKETEAEMKLRKQLNKDEIDSSVTLKFTIIPKISHPVGSSPDQISRHFRDKSYSLQNIINVYDLSSQFYGSELIAELQLAYITFIVGEAFEGFQQWKAVIILLCCCEDAIISHQKLFLTFLECLRYQIEVLPEDFQTEMLTDRNFIQDGLSRLVENIRTRKNLDQNLVKQKDLICDTLQSVLGIKIIKEKSNRENEENSEDDPDFKPTIVDLNEPYY